MCRTDDSTNVTVAQLLPFPVELDADVGYTGALFIDLQRRGGDDDPPDTACIDAEVQPVVWAFDVEGGRQAVVSDFGPTAALGAWVNNTHPVLILRNADQENIRF